MKISRVRIGLALIASLLFCNLSLISPATADFTTTMFRQGASGEFAAGTTPDGGANQGVMDSAGNFYYSAIQGNTLFADGCKGPSQGYSGMVMKGTTNNSGLASGIYSYYSNAQASSSLSISYPSAVTLDPNEVLFAADADCGKILRITDSGTATNYIDFTGFKGTTQNQFNPRGMGFNTTGDLIVADAAGSKNVWLVPTNDIAGGTTSTSKQPISIFKSDSATSFVESGATISSPAIGCTPWSVAVATNGTAFIGCVGGGTTDNNSKIIKLTPYSNNKYKAEILVAHPSPSYWPYGMGIDSDGRIYEAQNLENKIVRFNPASAATALAESVTVTSGFQPSGIFFDRVGNLYPIVDGRIKKATGVGRPYPPVGLRTTLGNRRVVLNWNTPGVTGIETYTVTATQGVTNAGSCESVWPNLTCTVMGLTPGVNYGFAITAKNSTGGESLPSAKVYATVLGSPDAPSIGTATLVDSRTASITFTPPASDGGSAITGYTVTSYPHGRTGTGASSPIQVTGLTFGSPETFTVTATNAIGTSDSSTASNIVTPNDVYSVTFDSQGGSSISSGTFVSGGAVTAPGSTPTKSGYSFNGWFAASAGGASLTFPYSPGVTSSITLYAQWTAVSTTPAPVVLGPPPSSFVVVANPKISRSTASLVCTSGTYKFKKQGGREEASQISAQRVSLLSNGAVVDSEKTLATQSSFDVKSSYKGTTMSCEVEIQQEEVVKTYSSLDKDAISAFEAVMTSAIYASNTTYYSERDAAYMKRDAGDTKLWKEMLDKAQVKREATKVQAGLDYIASLEKAGISILVAADKPAPVLTPTPTKSPEPPVTVNVQPIAMKKVGTIYFASGTYFLNDESKKTIKALATSIFLKSPTVVLSYGHTDVKGGTNNTLLSQNRAKAVAKMLRSLLPGQKIATGWYASSKPVATGNSKAALAKNRRVEIYIK